MTILTRMGSHRSNFLKVQWGGGGGGVPEGQIGSSPRHLDEDKKRIQQVEEGVMVVGRRAPELYLDSF